MKKITLLYWLLLAISTSAQAYNGNFPAGAADYRSGDYVAAFSRLKPLAESGDASSQYYVGLMISNGQGVPKDEALAFQWFEKSAKQGYAKAQNALGEMYVQARGRPLDYDQAQFWFRKAANQRLAIAQRNLGVLYTHAGDPHDYKKAVFWLEKAARQGDEIDQLTLANLYHHQGEIKDEAKSAYWMRKAANQGIADAQNSLGDHYRFRDGASRDYGKALYWYKRADSQGHVDAPYNIAKMYERGNGVHPDHATAVQWFCRAAKQENNNALYELQQAGAKATECLIELANQGQILAQEELGRFYENSIGAVHDYPLAAFWSRKAAERGSASALNRLGDLYALGNGVAADPVIAEMLYILARPKTSGSQHSSRIRQTLSDDQKNEARALASGWKEGTPLPEKSETGNISK